MCSKRFLYFNFELTKILLTFMYINNALCFFSGAMKVNETNFQVKNDWFDKFFTVSQRTENAKKTKVVKVGWLLFFLEGEWQVMTLAVRKKPSNYLRKDVEVWNHSMYKELNGTDILCTNGYLGNTAIFLKAFHASGSFCHLLITLKTVWT